MKTLTLYRHSEKDGSGRHISREGIRMANIVGGKYDDIEVRHLFCGPLIRTNETLIAMIPMNDGFDGAVIHETITGLGSQELFSHMVTDAVKQMIANGLSNLEAVKACHDEDGLRSFITDGLHALRGMFHQMADGEFGVGVFHDPTIPLLAEHLGMEDARSLESMEAICFRLQKDGNIVASWN